MGYLTCYFDVKFGKHNLPFIYGIRQDQDGIMNLLSVLLTLLHLALGAELSPEECKNLGFSTLSLTCSSCDYFARFSVSAAQVADCRKCCRDEGRKLDVRDSKYPKLFWKYVDDDLGRTLKCRHSLRVTALKGTMV